MHITNISEAKAQLSALIEKVLVGEEVIIGKAGKPVAKLVRYQRSEEQREPGAWTLDLFLQHHSPVKVSHPARVCRPWPDPPP